MRLIDANALLEKVVFRLPIDNKNAEVIAGCVDITRRLIENAPTVDAVEVVRCKDCQYSAMCEDGTVMCWVYRTKLHPDAFCSYGERKDNG